MPDKMNQFEFKIMAESAVKAKLFFVFQLANILNEKIDLQNYDIENQIQQIKINVMSFRPLSISNKNDSYKFKPQARTLHIDLNIDYGILTDSDEDTAKQMICEFLIFAFEEYIEVEGFDNASLVDDVKTLFVDYLPDD